MKILFGSLTYPLPNGVTTSINLAVDGFAQHGHESRIVAPNYNTGSVRPEHVPVSSSRILQVATNPLANKERFFGWSAPIQIQRLIKKFRPSAYWLHTVTWAPNAFEILMLRQEGPKVVTYHTQLDFLGELYAGQVGKQHMIRRSREVCNSVDHVIAPSRFTEKVLRTWGVETPISVIPTGITPPPEGYTKRQVAKRYNFDPNAKLLMYAGRIVAEKNIVSLLKMLAALQKIRQDVVLILVGSGQIAQMRKEATELGVSEKTVFTDKLENNELRKFYPAADLFVFASQSETQGLVIGEAMSVGLPVVALDSSIREQFYPEPIARVVIDEKNFATEVDKVLNNQKLMSELSASARKFYQSELIVDRMVNSQIALFEGLVDAVGFEPTTPSV